MSFRNNSHDPDIGDLIFLIIIAIFIIITIIQFITSKIEEILYVINIGWTWVLVFTICSILSGLLFYVNQIKVKRLHEVINSSSNEILKLNREIENLKKCISEKDTFYNTMSSLSDISVKNLTELVTDFKLIQYDISAKYLKTKKPPAKVEALRINELKKETKLYQEQYKQMLYKYEIMIGLFPELSTYIDDFESIKELNDFRNLDNLQNEYDRVRDYISKDSYNQMSINEKNQLALDCYIKRKKNKWQIGRDYEMYIAYLYRSKGWSVIQYGIEKKLEDMGRDLIVIGKDKILIIQCKYWSESKLIHEKHIAQLYGSTIEYTLNNNLSNDIIKVVPVFITNIDLSETAKRFAKTLNVTVYKFDMGLFPRIKCNINNKEKIYHLPFDQQYDRTKIENTGEFYAFSVKEATEAGFKRAHRFFGDF